MQLIIQSLYKVRANAHVRSMMHSHVNLALCGNQQATKNTIVKQLLLRQMQIVLTMRNTVRQPPHMQLTRNTAYKCGTKIL